MSRRIAVVTTSRADFGIYRPLLRWLSESPQAELQLVVGGGHLRRDLGHTVDEIADAGFEIAARVDHLGTGDAPLDIARAMARGTEGYAQAFAELTPDIVVLLGDRFEMHAAGVAAQPFECAVAHLHGGELTLGAQDDSFRHSLTKLSHLHFVATEDFAKRVRQLGEEAWRVTVCGALSLDNLKSLDLLDGPELERRIGLPLDPPPLLVTYHPETHGDLSPEAQADALVAALAEVDLPVVVTAPNADAGGRAVRARLEPFTSNGGNRVFVENLGTRAYFSLLRRAAAMVGNSSSGIIEAASFGLPVVNIGDRQEGRPRAANVIDVPAEGPAIAVAVRKAASDAFRAGLAGLANPYAGDTAAADIIGNRLTSVPLDTRLRKKGFIDG